uniref:Uncharacterized protein n=1 Tax=Bursaphelenchus xylophilus TaxID=6326 RepID=A0A1I7RK72_BURXY
MFDEAEPGKPKNWGWTIGIIITICLINLCIFIVLRLFLDAVDEYGEPLLQGDTRRDLEAFLGVFALSFCFGCWCCFCCAGNCLECIIFCFKSENRPTMTQWWSRMIRHKTDIMEKTKRRKDTVTSDIRKMSRRLKTAYTNENFCESDAEAQVQQTAAVGAKRSLLSDYSFFKRKTINFLNF